MIKTRFAPSPTGLLHLGNVRTALFSLLFARHNQGVFLLRIEDTDQTRSEDAFAVALQEDLLWLGLGWDEGPQHDLGNGPYFQAERQAIYEKYFTTLKESGLVYPCFCSEEELALSRKAQVSAGKPPRYAGTCANLTPEQVAHFLEHGKKPTWRFRVPHAQVVPFVDLARGEQRFSTEDIGDFVIRRTDGTFPFLFGNAIDDALMQVTHVMRGEDHVANTPRQLLILEALKLPKPEYVHIPLIVGEDNSPLSKRHGSWSVDDLRTSGYLPGAIINYLARLGHYYADNNYLTSEELAQQFDLNALQRAPARFDATQLQYWQKMALQRLNGREVWDWMGMVVQVLVPIPRRELFVNTILPNIAFPADAVDWAQRLFSPAPLVLQATELEIMCQAGKEFFKAAITFFENDGLDYNALTAYLKEKVNAQGKKLFQPLRLALTGQLHGPELPAILTLMGKEQIELRFQQALTHC